MSVPAAGIVTLVISMGTVLIMCIMLLRVILALKHVTFTLGTIIIGVRAIARQTSTVPSVLTSVNNNLAGTRAKAESVP